MVATALFAALALALPASAILNGYWAYDTFEGSLNTISFQRCSLTSDTLTAAQWSDTNNLEALDMSTAIYTCGADPLEREINIFDADYGDVSWAGLWTCNLPVSHMGVIACEAATIQISTRSVNASSPLDYDRAVLCHEHGHAVGLAHNAVSCMKSQPTSSNITYSIPEKADLNNIY